MVFVKNRPLGVYFIVAFSLCGDTGRKTKRTSGAMKISSLENMVITTRQDISQCT
jgi:hypothetical protein